MINEAIFIVIKIMMDFVVAAICLNQNGQNFRIRRMTWTLRPTTWFYWAVEKKWKFFFIYGSFIVCILSGMLYG
ncbi:hypothetical protein CJD36_009100 [Flavipsychrobacter stenotrophus]|uniref:Uncharacterized protein n=1 Tax=Flavipsychrobacter stenotrophus TaxID=2077091 RepID=A0A2S7SZ14_9BACT|nr:hypothetical protein CJD36_009100 [Flavipsychrobacter stenotrophus]